MGVRVEFHNPVAFFFFNWLYNPWWVLASPDGLTPVKEPLVPII
jgi:hypothetical protein